MSAKSIVTRRHGPPQPGAEPATFAVERNDLGINAEITLIGDIDLESAPLVRQALTRCLLDGARTIDVDLTSVDFCDCTGLSAFLHAHHCAAAVGATVRLHHPTRAVARLFALTRTESVLLP
ncbi:STAS domain-containing protein [Streptacidiphilus jiangxiensis]|uniref:Anti-sigma factor antagonist n=1 Tax=Streptacidiphilus jiangxiensis TaxID=235985 RepID=A0A1H7HDS0_STRJI|nr:STAS domain-containing protein [Streptacidiphilus jiangxiensis]SEK47110.1 anti-anti-sigma factor [Streptacidiphilus jiangxiensis]